MDYLHKPFLVWVQSHCQSRIQLLHWLKKGGLAPSVEFGKLVIQSLRPFLWRKSMALCFSIKVFADGVRPYLPGWWDLFHFGARGFDHYRPFFNLSVNQQGKFLRCVAAGNGALGQESFFDLR